MASLNISSLTAMLFVVVVVFGSMAIPTKAQQSCANDLLPCGDYLNNTNKPSTACCTAISETVSTQLPCLYNLYFNSNILQALGATTESALRIATACGVDSVGVDQCKVGFEKRSTPLTTVVCEAIYGAVKGDTCGGVAQMFDMSLQSFLSINPNINCRSVFVGQWLCVDGTTV